MEKLFALYDNNGKVGTKQIIKFLESNGIFLDDARLFKTKQKLREYNDQLIFTEFMNCFESSCDIIDQIINKNMIIPDFEDFTDQITKFYNETRGNDNGKLATYIPQLANISPEKFGISICTIDGQRFNIGDCKEEFCIQSCCKPINYCIAIENNTPDIVHRHVGHEQSGQRFNAIVFDENNLPHNPLINAGAIMTCSLIERGKNCADRFDSVMKIWKQLAGNKFVGYNNSVYLSERDNADINHALARIMKARDIFPENTDINKVLDFYFQCCSIMLTTNTFAIVASTLANGGVCPLTNVRIFSPETVRNCLSIMYSSGMYDYSGKFAFSIGIPAKSGVGGGIYLVIPNVMGICIWSPKLDKYGNSVRGIEICEKIVDVYNFHNFDNINNKINPVNHN